MLKGLTNSQNLVLQTLISVFFAAIIGALTAGLQYILNNGHLDYKILLSVVIAAFGAYIGKAFIAYVPANAPVLIQAIEDTKAQTQAILAPQAPVVIHTASTNVTAPAATNVQPVKDSTPRESPPQPQQTIVPLSDVAQQPFPPAPPVVPLAATSATMVIQDKTYRVSLEPVDPQGTDVTQKIAAVKAV